MKLYEVKITETLTITVEIEAENELSAWQQASDRWRNSEYILDADNFSDVSFCIWRHDFTPQVALVLHLRRRNFTLSAERFYIY